MAALRGDRQGTGATKTPQRAQVAYIPTKPSPPATRKPTTLKNCGTGIIFSRDSNTATCRLAVDPTWAFLGGVVPPLEHDFGEEAVLAISVGSFGRKTFQWE